MMAVKMYVFVLILASAILSARGLLMNGLPSFFHALAWARTLCFACAFIVIQHMAFSVTARIVAS